MLSQDLDDGGQRADTFENAFFGSYGRSLSGFDEAIDERGNVRPHWRGFAAAMGAMSEADQQQRHERLRRLVAENGIAHDLFAEPSAQQPWSIDIAPIILSPSEWAMIEKGLVQRARLADLVTKDIYGPQTLLRSGKIPPRLIFSDETYLRACRDAGDQGQLVTFFAADLIRDIGGNWRIIDAHAETPAGLGFALANRLVHGQIMGDVLTQCHAMRLAAYFRHIQTEMLARIVRDDPLIALLTPGPNHEDYFGHAYLSRYLGFQLIEGGDLRVIGNRVYMKTLEGLKPLDMIIRCVPGAACDPLELDPDGYMGPAGLVRALRKNPSLVINFLGSAIIENRGLAPLLPGICKTLLNEDLVLEDAPRRWLGDMKARVFVFSEPDRFIIRKAHEGTGRPGRASQGILPERLSNRELEDLKFELELNGQDYVAEQRVKAATAPSWTPEGLKPRSFAMRLYVAGFGGEYRVMPGGLALSLSDERIGVSMSAMDGHSRDVWVQSDKEAIPHISLLRPAGEVAHVLRAGQAIRSRVADNLFWLGRYSERADWTLRLMRGGLTRAEDAGLATVGDGGRKALAMLLAKDVSPDTAAHYEQTHTVEECINLLLAGADRAYGLPAIANNMLRVGSIVRERLSLELWHTLQRFVRTSHEPIESTDTLTLLERLNTGIITLAALNGFTAENMTRNYGWYFHDMGHRLERALNLAELLLTLCGQVKPGDDETARLFFVLNVADSTITFRQRYLFAPVLPLVLDLLLADETNPRGICYQLARISDHLAALPQAGQHGTQSDEQKLILEILTRVRLADVSSLAHTDANGQRAELIGLLGHLVSVLPKLSEAITRRYFNLTDEMRRVYTRFGFGLVL